MTQEGSSLCQPMSGRREGEGEGEGVHCLSMLCVVLTDWAQTFVIKYRLHKHTINQFMWDNSTNNICDTETWLVC